MRFTFKNSNRTGWLWIVLGAGAFGAAAYGCGSSANDCSANKDCQPAAGASGSAGVGGTAGASGGGTGGSSGMSGSSGVSGSAGDGGAAGEAGGDAGPTCDPSKTPAEDPCVLSNDLGVFVSVNGDDTAGDGSRANPLKTIGAGVAMAQGDAARKRVYVCAGTYAEKVAVPDGLAIYGGLDCADWSYGVTNHVQIHPSDATALTITNAMNKGVTLEDLEITASDATLPGGSSFGVTIVNSLAALRRVSVAAGAGAKGSDGVAGDKGADGDMATNTAGQQRGRDALCTAPPSSQMGGAWPMDSACGAHGGTGGTALKDGVTVGQNGLPGAPSTNLATPGVGTGGPGGMTAGANGTTGMDGSNGSPGSKGTQAVAIGVFASSGFAPANGSDGTDGFPGQGGGGGGASMGSATCVGASGGAGGMAGCGGTKGTRGMGGGASIALLGWQSTVTLDACTLAAKAGGAGGLGGDGGVGGQGMAGGGGGSSNTGNSIGKGGGGGLGGDGGNAGPGSGGTGGPSIALAYTTNMMPTFSVTPVYTAATTPAPKGAGGKIGTNTANWAPDGMDGMTANTYEIP